VAFNVGDVLPAEKPIAAEADRTQLMEQSLPDTPPSRLDSIPPASVSDPAIDFDATLAFDPEESVERAQQAMNRSEPVSFVPDHNGDSVPPPPPLPVFESAPANEQDSFVTVIAGSNAVNDSIPEQPAPVAAAPKKKSGKAFAILGGLVAFLILAAGAAGAGWYYYNNYYAAAAVEPTPSPAPTVEATPIPSPTAEQVVAASPSPADSPTALEDANANTSETATRPDVDGGTTRPAQTTRPAANRPTTAPKATPKPKTNPGRTDIQQ